MILLLGAEIIAFHSYCDLITVADKNPQESKYRWYTEESKHSRLGPSSTFLVREMLSGLWISSNILSLSALGPIPHPLRVSTAGVPTSSPWSVSWPDGSNSAGSNRVPSVKKNSKKTVMV